MRFRAPNTGKRSCRRAMQALSVSLGVALLCVAKSAMADGADEGPRQRSEFTVHGPVVPVNLQASEPLTLYAEDAWVTHNGNSATGYARICTSPCTFTMPAGTQTFALSRAGGDPTPLDAPVAVQGPSALNAEWRSRQGLRTAGILLLAIGAPAGTLMAVGGDLIACGGTNNRATCTWTQGDALAQGLVIGGVVVAVASVVAGVLLVTRHDKPAITITPLEPVPPAPGAAPGMSVSADARHPWVAASAGAAVTVRF
jgi:hypothetical protein